MIDRGILFFLVLTICICGVAYFLPARSNGVEATILIKDTGFDPENIVIERGTKVIFKNIGEQLHWPASNLHPTHGIYPEFDPQQPIEPGGEWNFVFDKAGVWRYHDHLNPILRGTINVEK